jgi:hypothetical protein
MGHKRQRLRQRNAERRGEVLLVEEEVRTALQKNGLTLRVNNITLSARNKTTTFHWMIEDQQGRRVLDFWPVSGTWWHQPTGKRGRLTDPGAVVDLATTMRRRRNHEE